MCSNPWRAVLPICGHLLATCGKAVIWLGFIRSQLIFSPFPSQAFALPSLAPSLVQIVGGAFLSPPPQTTLRLLPVIPNPNSKSKSPNTNPKFLNTNPNFGRGIFESSSSNNTQTITSYPKSKSPNPNPKFLNPNPNCGRGNFEPSSSNNTQTITSYPWLSITAVQPSLSKLATRSTLRIFSPSRTVRNPRCPQGMLLIRWNIPFFTHQFPPPSRNSVKSIKIHLSLVHPCQKISRSFMRILISKQSTRNAFICCRFMALSVAHL